MGQPPDSSKKGLSTGCIVALVVAAIVVPLLAVGGFLVVIGDVYFTRVKTSAHEDVARIQISSFDNAIKYYRLHVGAYPTTEQGLAALREAPPDLADPQKWRGPYQEKEIPLDPWDNPYQYELIGPTEYRIWSYGPDTMDGTEDDIVVREPGDSL